MQQITTQTSNTISKNQDLFLDYLLQSQTIEKSDLSNLKQKSSAEEIFDLLLDRGVDEASLYKAYAKYVDIPFIQVNHIEPDVSDVIDVESAKSFGLIPFNLDRNSKTLQAAFFNVDKLKHLNKEAREDLEKRLNINFEFFITTKSMAENALATYGQPEPKSLENVDLSQIDTPLPVYKKMPIDLAKKFNAIIFAKKGEKSYDLAAADPSDPKLKDLIKFVEDNAKLNLKIYPASQDQISAAIARYQDLLNQPEPSGDTGDNLLSQQQGTVDSVPSKSENPEKMESKQSSVNKKSTSSMEDTDLVSFLSKEDVTVEDLKNYASSQMIPQLVAGLVMLASRERASDIHIEPFEKAIRVRFRVDGELEDVILLSANMTNSIVARVKILSKLKLDEQRVPQDGRFDATVGNQIIDIRVSTLPTVFGEKVVMRLLSKNKDMEKLEDLGIEGLSYDRIIEAISRPYGVLLATGPTGSGKSTSLYSILTRLNKPQVNIITLEDPVEYELQGINQVQVKPQIGFGFAEGLRSVLRQDPNIIMVGEIRDADTAELVTHAALTGHLVLSTLHTNDASGALPRLFNLDVEPFLLTSAINAVVAQRLVRKICPKCRREIEPPQSVVFEVKRELEKLNLNIPLKFYKGEGCSACKNGFSGRIGIFEVLTMTDEIEDLVLNEKTADDIFKSAVNSGMITMRQDGFIKAVKGITTIDEVLRVTNQK